MVGTLVTIGFNLATKLLTEKMVATIAIMILERLAKSTKNDVDDQILKAVKEALL